MTTSTAMGPMFWRQLLALIDERRVVPIVGPDAVVIEGDRGPRPLTEYTAMWVERLLELQPVDTPSSLNDVACRYLAVAGNQQITDVYWAVKQALSEHVIEPPAALRKLARIRPFDLYVTTTFDDLLRRAVDIERFDGTGRTRSFAYSPERVEDLPAPVAELGAPVVYHLLGRMSAVPDYVVTEEDTLEFVHSLQSDNHRPNLLMDELRSRSLLIIGSGYSNWLARFFLRIAKRERLLLARSKTDVVAETRGAQNEAELGAFLKHFSAQTKVYPGGALEFIDELAERWEAHAGSQMSEAAPSAEAASDIPEHAIFVSYASEDREIASALADALERAGLPVWFDRGGGLQGGDDYENKIRRYIESASIFIPVLTTNALTPLRRFFKFEWDVAREVARRASDTLPYVMPVRVGEVPPDHREIPDFIRRTHWLDGDDNEYSGIADRVRTVYRQYQMAVNGAG